jgi:hypothetical protein
MLVHRQEAQFDQKVLRQTHLQVNQLICFKYRFSQLVFFPLFCQMDKVYVEIVLKEYIPLRNWNVLPPHVVN